MSELTRFLPRPSLLVDYSAKHGIDATAFRSDGALVLFFDAKYRVILRPLSQGRVVLLSTLADLESFTVPDRLDFLMGLMPYATGLLRDHACCLVLDESRSALLLQQLLPSGFDVNQLEDQLADFLNILAFWHNFIQEKSGRLQVNT